MGTDTAERLNLQDIQSQAERLGGDILGSYGLQVGDVVHDGVQVVNTENGRLILKYPARHSTSPIGFSPAPVEQRRTPPIVVTNTEFTTEVIFDEFDGVHVRRDIVFSQTRPRPYRERGPILRLIMGGQKEVEFNKPEQAGASSIEITLNSPKRMLKEGAPKNIPFGAGTTRLRIGDLEIYPPILVPDGYVDFRRAGYQALTDQGLPPEGMDWFRKSPDPDPMATNREPIQDQIFVASDNDRLMQAEPLGEIKINRNDRLREMVTKFPSFKRIYDALRPIMRYIGNTDTGGWGKTGHHLGCRQLDWNETAKQTIKYLAQDPQPGTYDRWGIDLDQMLVFDPVKN